MAHPIDALRVRIEAQNPPGTPSERLERLSVTASGDCFHLKFYGDCFGGAYSVLCETLSLPEVSSSVLSLSLRGPDEGANGTRNWDLAPLIPNGHGYPFLETFSVQLNQPGDHNRTIIASTYEEDGVIARFVAGCPRLVHLRIPSAPSEEIFKQPLEFLRFLTVDAGYDTQNFLRHFANSEGFPALRCFEWGEYSENYMDDWQTSCTPVSDYQALFSSPVFNPINRFVLRQPMLTAEEIRTLRTTRPKLQFLLVRFS
jgi:hypothetical protein